MNFRRVPLYLCTGLVGASLSLMAGLISGNGAWAGDITRSATSIASSAPRLPAQLFGGSFDLIDHNGQARTDKDFQGRFMLVFFGYTYCPDICPTNLQSMSSALDMLAPEQVNRVQPLFVSVDPGRDRPEVLKNYVGHFHKDLMGLTGTEDQVRRVSKAYRIHRSKVITDAKAAPDDYLVNHSSLTYLMAPNGNFVTIFPHDTSSEKIAAVLQRHLSGS